MEGNIYINGTIGSMPMENGVILKDIISQVKHQPNATSFNVHINSEGGIVDVGFDIHDYIKSLGVPIKTIGSGIVASIATVIFMAGNERVLRDGTSFMIHLPMGGVDGTADEIESFSKEVRAVEDRLTKFYSELTNIDKEAVRALLKAETWLTGDEAINMGFATTASLPIAAKAYFNTNTNNNTNMTKDDKSWIEDKFNSIMNLFKSSIKNIVVQDAEGREIDFPTVEEGQTIAEGDQATIDGIAAEGDVTMPNGQVITFEGGAVVSIMQPEETSEEPVDEYKEKYEALKADFDAMTAIKDEFEAKETAKDEVIATLKKEIVNFKKEITSKFEIETKKEVKKGDAQELSPAQKALQAIRNKNNNK